MNDLESTPLKGADSLNDLDTVDILPTSMPLDNRESQWRRLMSPLWSKEAWTRRLHAMRTALLRPSTKTTRTIVGFKERYETIDMYTYVDLASTDNDQFANMHTSLRGKLMRFFFFEQSWFFLVIVGWAMALIALGIDFTLENIAIFINYCTNTGFTPLNGVAHLLLALAFASLAWLLTDKIAPTAAGSGIPVVRSALSGIYLPHYFNIRTLLVKIFGLICALSAGLSIGREGPYVHCAACVANLLSNVPGFDRVNRNLVLRYQMMAAGCAAGVATAFGAPIGGVIFAIEVTSTFYLVRNLWMSFFCAAAAASLVMLLGDQGLVALFVTTFDPLPYTSGELIAFTLMGITFGLAGVAWIHLVKRIMVVRERYAILAENPMGQVVLVAVITAMFGSFFPFVARSDAGLIGGLFDSEDASNGWDHGALLVNLVTFVVLKFWLTALAVTQALPVGLYTPVFMIGAAAGRFVGELLRLSFPLWSVRAGGYAVVGAAAFSAGVTRTLSTAVIVFEVTGQLHHLLPVLIAVIIAAAVGNAFSASIYDVLLEFKGLPFMPSFNPEKAYMKTASHIMRRVNRALRPRGVTYLAAEAILARYNLMYLPVTDKRGNLVGSVKRDEVQRLVDYREAKWQAYITRREQMQRDSTAPPIEALPGAAGAAAARACDSASMVGDVNVDELQGVTDTSQMARRRRANDEKAAHEAHADQSAESSTSTSASPRRRMDGTTAGVDNDMDELVTVQHDGRRRNAPTRADAAAAAAAAAESEHESITQSLATAAALIDDDDDATRTISEEAPSGPARYANRREYMDVDMDVDLETLQSFDSCPMSVGPNTPLSKVYFLFAMLGLGHAFVTFEGKLSGVITKEGLMLYSLGS